LAKRAASVPDAAYDAPLSVEALPPGRGPLSERAYRERLYKRSARYRDFHDRMWNMAAQHQYHTELLYQEGAGHDHDVEIAYASACNGCNGCDRCGETRLGRDVAEMFAAQQAMVDHERTCVVGRRGGVIRARAYADAETAVMMLNGGTRRVQPKPAADREPALEQSDNNTYVSIDG